MANEKKSNQTQAQAPQPSDMQASAPTQATPAKKPLTRTQRKPATGPLTPDQAKRLDQAMQDIRDNLAGIDALRKESSIPASALFYAAKIISEAGQRVLNAVSDGK